MLVALPLMRVVVCAVELLQCCTRSRACYAVGSASQLCCLLPVASRYHRSAQQPAAPTYQLTLRKPLGLVLTERNTAAGPEVFVDEVVAGETRAWPQCERCLQHMRWPWPALIPHVACPAAHPPRADGNAAKDGRVQVGDVLTKCSAVLLKAGKEGEYEREGYGQR